MSNHLKHILSQWYPLKNKYRWVLATIFSTEGSSYRKMGAHMLINDLGQYHGLLSGGCLESDIMNQARRCWENDRNRIVTYDMREEEDLAWQLGIGCGGLVNILLQPISSANEFLMLDKVYHAVCNSEFALYQQQITQDKPNNHFEITLDRKRRQAKFLETTDGKTLVQTIAPPFHLAVFGGGIDAQPLVNIAAQLGWTITLLDSRSAYARKEYFPFAHTIIKTKLDALINKQHEALWSSSIDAAIIMGHNVSMDADALRFLAESSAKYVGILGPIHRTDRVFEKAQLERADYPITIANPVGLRLGGELPESIALSIVSEVHSFLEQANGHSISEVLNR